MPLWNHRCSTAVTRSHQLTKIFLGPHILFSKTNFFRNARSYVTFTWLETISVIIQGKPWHTERSFCLIYHYSRFWCGPKLPDVSNCYTHCLYEQQALCTLTTTQCYWLLSLLSRICAHWRLLSVTDYCLGSEHTDDYSVLLTTVTTV